MVTGLLLGFGFFLAIVISIAAVILVVIIIMRVWKGRGTADVSVWKAYLEEITQAEKYDEAGLISKLIEGCADDFEIKTPKGYVVDKVTDFTISNNGNLRFETQKFIVKESGKNV